MNSSSLMNFHVRMTRRRTTCTSSEQQKQLTFTHFFKDAPTHGKVIVQTAFNRSKLGFVRALVLTAALLSLHAQQTQLSASNVLQHALHLADLYNWADAATEFGEAEKMFLAAGDQRNALYAKLGGIRSNIEQRKLPVTSAELAAELETNPLLQTDKPLRMFCLIVKGDIDGEIDSGAMRQDWEQVQALASELGDAKWQYRALAQLGLAAFYDGDLATARKNVASALAARGNSRFRAE
jgi:hypothetical protein